MPWYLLLANCGAAPVIYEGVAEALPGAVAKDKQAVEAADEDVVAVAGVAAKAAEGAVPDNGRAVDAADEDVVAVPSAAAVHIEAVSAELLMC